MSGLPVFWLFFIGLVAVNAGLYRKDEFGAEGRDYFLHPDEDGNIMYVNLKEGDVPSNLIFNPAKDIHLNLYTKRNPSESQQLRPDDDVGLWVSNFLATNPTRLLVHGWMTQSDNDDAYILLKDTYLSHQDMNVIIVDWKAGSNNIDYIDAKDNVEIVAAYIARFLDQVVAKTGIKTNSIQLVGEHLGAHVVGLAGRKIKSGRIHTITGLEPALPLYSIKDRDSRINEDSADYVEIIHTTKGVVGFYEPIGHADFYPNAVYTQPGCGLDLDASCSHERALEYFIESLSSDTGFWSWNCESFVGLKNKECKIVGELRPMGVLKGVTTNQGLAKGIYYLKTKSASPYAKGSPDPSQLGEVISVNNH